MAVSVSEYIYPPPIGSSAAFYNRCHWVSYRLNMYARDGGGEGAGRGDLVKRDADGLLIFWIVAGIGIAISIAMFCCIYFNGRKRRGRGGRSHGGGHQSGGRAGGGGGGGGGGGISASVNPGRYPRHHALRKNNSQTPAAMAIDAPLSGLSPGGGDDCGGGGAAVAPPNWTWFGLGFACGYGTFVVMLGLFLGRQMTKLPWLWEVEIAKRRREAEAEAAAAAAAAAATTRVPPPPPATSVSLSDPYHA
ncbi:hypothetical protein JDV02_006020 [Purpureocillium takamizusanense]|uniref:Uncharacterized protein n=1 Tax=Purpureocillium takamizusanense TaxID=2060973 RepID=A0A9Q8QHT4_9HYPO|nr:uncharacterized protein JDV02_006020 [Purpureocillium takamizusanense]UNI19875.1 hypothetical protein JDV02_006020 [Purpureocillium takamizusanense]